MPYGDEALFANRVIWVGHGDGQRVPEHGCGLLKPDAVIALVATFLIGIPCEAHLWLQ